VDEFQENVDKLGILSDEIIALMPAEPGTELEAKVAELLARLVQHLEYMDETGDEDVEAGAAGREPAGACQACREGGDEEGAKRGRAAGG
jgi:hypothetical protein